MPERHRFPWWDDHDDPANAGERYLKEPLTTGELHALIGACLTHGLSGIRNRALLAGTGLRLSEALAAAPRDVTSTTASSTSGAAKGARHRSVHRHGPRRRPAARVLVAELRR